MPYSNASSLKVFLSYAKEDEKIAIALSRTLRQAFYKLIEITMMNEFSTGKNWRQIIENSILETDIFIAIETGQLKPSHSYTGKEVGMFDISKRLQPRMKCFPHMDRLMIPFAVLTRPTASTDEYEGIDIDPSKLYDLRFNPDEYVSKDGRQDVFIIDDNNKMLKLLRDLDKTVAAAKKDPHSDLGIAAERDDQLKEFAGALSEDLFQLLLARKKFIDRPKTKIILKVPTEALDSGDLISKSIIKLDGNFEDIFGTATPGDEGCKWEEFIKDTEIDVSFQWSKAISSVLKKAADRNKIQLKVKDIEASVFLDDVTIISFDRRNIFRLMSSEFSVYYNNSIEMQIYAVPILRIRDFGDATTTLLLHAAEIGLGYRFTFLEEGSAFSPIAFAAESPARIKERISNMIDRLTWLIVRSEDYQLNDPLNLIATMGPQAVAQVGSNYRIWDEAKNALFVTAKQIIAKDRVSFDDQKAIVDAVTEFVNRTKDMNSIYTSEVLLRLRQKIFDDGGARSPPAPAAVHISLDNGHGTNALGAGSPGRTMADDRVSDSQKDPP